MGISLFNSCRYPKSRGSNRPLPLLTVGHSLCPLYGNEGESLARWRTGGDIHADRSRSTWGEGNSRRRLLWRANSASPGKLSHLRGPDLTVSRTDPGIGDGEAGCRACELRV